MNDNQAVTENSNKPHFQQLAAAAVAVALAQEQIRQQAAAAAVAAAFLLYAPAEAKPLPTAGGLLSPWQLIMRSNQLAKKSRGSLR